MSTLLKARTFTRRRTGATPPSAHATMPGLMHRVVKVLVACARALATALGPKLLGGRATTMFKTGLRTACTTKFRTLTLAAKLLRLLMPTKLVLHPALVTLPTTTVHLPALRPPLRRAETFTTTR
ncbi:MAG: hypothetical protein K9N47_02100 [Prosthecobacter sp.]|uniref:hypothetical protein n=1 Tax=Prosthecobacter sp. TaxID=1965333 RepID=UPI0025F12E6F|nr:hypothetical protein [Prosthecobacter sp.]MCF7784880.1 hypothetical protein [Prosthecobacter sp.]